MGVTSRGVRHTLRLFAIQWVFWCQLQSDPSGRCVHAAGETGHARAFCCLDLCREARNLHTDVQDVHTDVTFDVTRVKHAFTW